MTNPQKTPLYEEHVKLNGRIVDFAGWSLPVQYVGVKEEHINVRKNVGLFDVSHMGEIRFLGPKALESLEWMTTNSVSRLETGDAQYSLIPNEQGGLVDDIIIYCLQKNSDYLVCVNASNSEKDFQWFKDHNQGAEIINQSSFWAQIAIQGPKASELCQRIFQANSIAPTCASMKPFTVKSAYFKEHPILIASTGYTGDKGVEIYIEKSGASKLWQLLMECGQDLGVMPIGLGARDTLRMEMKYPLYGNEINDTMNPYAAGLGWVIKPDLKDFLGKSILLDGKNKGLPQKLVGFKMLEKGIPRTGYSLFSFDNQEMGKVTSGTHSPSLDAPIGIGYVDSRQSEIGTEILVDIRGKKIKAVVCKTPFIEK